MRVVASVKTPFSFDCELKELGMRIVEGEIVEGGPVPE